MCQIGNSTNNQFHCDECIYRTILKAYLGDHVRMMHTKEGCGMWMCAFGKCASRPVTFPNQKRLDKHKTCHSNEKCVLCEKNFNAKRKGPQVMLSKKLERIHLMKQCRKA